MNDPKQREKCLKEVKLMQPLDHPNLIKYKDSFIYNNELIIVTEWAEKGDLKRYFLQFLQKKKLFLTIKRLMKQHQSEETPFEELKIWEYMN